MVKIDQPDQGQNQDAMSVINAVAMAGVWGLQGCEAGNSAGGSCLNRRACSSAAEKC